MQVMAHLLLKLLDQDLVTSLDVLEEEEDVEEELDILILSRVLLAITTIAS